MTTDTSTSPPDLPGLSFVRWLGRGGYAEVFLYEQVNPRMPVAVKILTNEGLAGRTRERFAAEANAMAQLADHPNIVQVFRADVTADGRPYLVMKYYPQRNLAVRAQSERLPVPEVLQIGVRIACAVETAHRAGILHRDIKPANILTSQYGEPGLTDFGISTTAGGGDEAEAEGMSVPWAPPEVLFGTTSADRSADVYSLGATLWHLLAGRSPFEIPGGDNTSLALMRRIREQPPPRTGRDDVPVSLERLLTQTMSKRPSDRPQSALQLARALQEIESEQRWSPTALVLLDDQWGMVEEAEASGGHEGGRVLSTDPGPATKVRSPQTVLPHPLQPARTSSRPVVDPGLIAGPATGPTSARVEPKLPDRVRQAMPEAPDEPGTIQRVAVSAEPPADVAPRPTAVRRRPKRWQFAVTAAVLVGAAIGVGVALARPKPGAGTTSTTLSTPAPSLPVVAPAAPAVNAVRIDATQVKFSWSEADPHPGDDFAWKEEGASQWTPASGNSVVLNVPTGEQVCLVVEVGRADNTEVARSTKCSS